VIACDFLILNGEPMLRWIASSFAMGTVLLAAATVIAADRVERDVAGGDRDITIHMIQKQPAKPRAGLPVLMLHAFGSPCGEAYDLAPGLSWMDDLSAAGFPTYAIDFRGFGQSSRPVADAPVDHAQDAVRDVISVIEVIRKETGATKVSLVGWSWGAVVAPMVAIARPDLVNRMVLLGAMHAFTLPMMTEPFASKDDPDKFAPARIPYQKLQADLVLAHWRMMLKGSSGLVDEPTIARVQALAERCGHTDEAATPKIVTRPMGPLADLFEIWRNHPIYDASAVKAPTLVIRGDRDIFADQGLAAKIPGAQEKIVVDATHWAPYERNRDQILDAARRFFLTRE